VDGKTVTFVNLSEGYWSANYIRKINSIHEKMAHNASNVGFAHATSAGPKKQDQIRTVHA
jgi:hypothetical protein